MSRWALAAIACAAACDARAQGGAGPAAAPAPGQAANLPVPVPLMIPTGWKALEAPTEAGRAALGATMAERATVRSWGEPGLGCFVTVVEVTSPRAEPLVKVAAELQQALGALLDVEGWAFVDGAIGEVTGTIARSAAHGRDPARVRSPDHPLLRGALRGRLRADAAGVPHAAVAACFYNEREPERCQRACTALLAGLEAPRVTP
jgi:hypothetical protein